MNFLDNFIIIDDDKINNKLCRKIIEKIYPESTITDFINPVEGFDYVSRIFPQSGNDPKAILLLDISMPVMNAWDFLAQFDKLDESITRKVKIYVLSSSIDKDDMVRAQSNPHVEYYLIKPLTRESIRLIVHVLNKREGLI
jgi:two-component SAPR family response regulator